MSARSDGAVSRTGRADSELPLPDERVAMPGMSREEEMHSGSQSQNLRELVRTGPAGARELAKTPTYQQSRRERNKVEALFRN